VRRSQTQQDGHGELVVDTTAFLDKQEFDFVDNWRTPHTKDMHVVERFRLIDGGRGLEATVTVDDPGTFDKPWSGMARWQRVNRQMLETICAENNEAFEKYFVNLKEYPMPEAKRKPWFRSKELIKTRFLLKFAEVWYIEESHT
jgi:hypothetical protein